MKNPLQFLLLTGALALSAAVQAAEPYVNVTVGGVLRPGVYGRIEVGTAPPPPVYYPQPVIISRPVAVPQAPVQPVYLYVPPGHQKKWAKHCQKYSACGQPVYFVNAAQYESDKHGRPSKGKHNEYDSAENHGKGYGKGHSKEDGHGKDKHKD